jgi:hypothetical protein
LGQAETTGQPQSWIQLFFSARAKIAGSNIIAKIFTFMVLRNEAGWFLYDSVVCRVEIWLCERELGRLFKN